MLTLNDGRSELWQWDTGRKLTVDADCSQVHFSNKVFGRSIDVDVVDGVAIIPDILLQTDKELTAWAFVGTPENGYTKISKVFKVNKRNKPADYVFTPPEQTTLGELIKRIDKIEETQDPDAIKNAVDNYLANNPIKVEETDPTVSDWAKAKEKPKYTADEVGSLSKTELFGAVNDALAQAKESGEFDGKDGVDGKDGTDYVLTEADKAEIAEMAAELVEVPDSGGNAALSADQISALDGMFKVCAFTKADVSAEYNAFKTAFGITDSGEEEPDEPVVPPDEPDTPEVTLTSISATYSGGGVAVGTAVTDLTGIVVTAHYSDGSTETVTGYTLSGEIAEGSNTVTVSYGGKTATFTVTGVAESGGEGENPVEPVYMLTSATTFDKTSVLDTGYALADKDKDWTIFSDITGKPGYGVPVWSVGDKIGLWAVSAWKWFCGYTAVNTGFVSGNNVSILDSNNVTNLKTVLVHAKGSETITVYYISNSALTSAVSSERSYSNIIGSDTVCLGGQKDDSDRWWEGTINDFKIYERVLADDEIKTYMGVA